MVKAKSPWEAEGKTRDEYMSTLQRPRRDPAPPPKPEPQGKPRKAPRQFSFGPPGSPLAKKLAEKAKDL